MDRVSTGNPQLDRILSGGFPRHSINVIMGAPGSGKTVLAEELAFANASSDRPVLYLTTVSEPLAKMVDYLQAFTFADPGRIGTEVIYRSLSEELKSRPESLYAELLELIKTHRPGIIVVDSFKAIADLVPDPQLWRRIVFDLAGLLTAYDATTFWVGEYTWESGSGPLEFAIVDGILELQRIQRGSRDERYLRVAKLRGSGFQDGSHAFDIGPDGLRVFPRLVMPARGLEYGVEWERLQTGIEGLDDMIERGWLRGTSTLVEGPSGAGKTMLALHFLRRGVEDGEPGLLVNFQENPAQIRRSLESLGWDADALVGPGKLDQLYISPVELQIDTIVQEVFRRIDACGVRRVAIDALGDLWKSAQDTRRFDDYVYSLTQYFAARGVTAMLTLETRRVAVGEVPPGGSVSFMSDNIVLLSMELGEQLVRGIRILKSRASAHDGRRHQLRITARGLGVE